MYTRVFYNLWYKGLANLQFGKIFGRRILYNLLESLSVSSYSGVKWKLHTTNVRNKSKIWHNLYAYKIFRKFNFGISKIEMNFNTF